MVQPRDGRAEESLFSLYISQLADGYRKDILRADMIHDTHSPLTTLHLEREHVPPECFGP